MAACLLAPTGTAGGAMLAGGGGSQALAAAMCGTDDFDGSALDDARWDVLRPDPAGLTVSAGKLSLTLSNSDLISGTNTAQNVVLQDAPAGGWIAATRMNVAGIDANGEQAGLALWKSEGPPAANNVFGKITFIQTTTGTRQFEAIWTDGGGVAVPIGSSGTGAVSVPQNADIDLRMRYDGSTVTAEYSLDGGATWTQIGRPARYSGPLRVGLLALRNSAPDGSAAAFEKFDLACGPDVTAAASTTRGAAPLTVDFDGTASTGASSPSWDFGDGTTAVDAEDTQHTFTQPGTYAATFSARANGIVSQVTKTITVVAADPPCPAAGDEFAGNALDPKWQLLRPRLTGLDVSGGYLRLSPYGGDMHGVNATVRNVILQNAPAGPWTATTRIDTSGLTAQGDQAGLLVWRGETPNNFAKIVFNRRATGYWVERQNNVNNITWTGGGNPGTVTATPTQVFIRVSSDGAANPQVSAQYSPDGSTWTAVQAPFTVGGYGPLKVGIGYWGPEGLRKAAFDYFRVSGPRACGDADDAAPTTTLTSPGGPAAGGAHPARPLTLHAVDDANGSGVEKTEYRVDGGDWTTYSGPITPPADAKTLDYRSTDRAGNAEAPKSATIDGAAPTTTATLDPTTPGDGPVTVSLSASDGSGSGIDAIQYRVDGGAWKNYTDPAEEAIFDGTAASLSQWAQVGSGSFALQPSGAIETSGGLGMLWYPVKPYGDFSLKFQFRDVRTGADFSNGGAFVRFPDPRVPVDQRPDACAKTGNAATQPAWVAIYCGHEIQIFDSPLTSGEQQKTGSIYNFVPLGIDRAKPVAKGQWSDYEIRVVGQQYTIIRNGEVLNRFDNSVPAMASRAGDPPTQDRQITQGYIGLQNHGTDDKIQYRDVRVSDLSGSAAGAFTVSENGQHVVEYRSRDAAGNLEPAKTVRFQIGEPKPVNIFDTIGITEEANKGNSQIYGQPTPYSLPAEEMPPSRSIVQGGTTDPLDDVWFRMPNTTGTVPNLAGFHGQTVILRSTEQKQYAKVHFFGTTTDGGPAGGDFVLTYTDGSTQTATVRFRDWCNAGDPAPEHHIAIGPLTHRWRTDGQDGAQCGIYHVPVAIDPAKTLESVRLPSSTTPGNPPIQAYLMALTLEQPDGNFVMPDLGASPFPDDLTAPTASATLDPGTPQGQAGWYKSNVTVTLAAADEDGGSGLDTIEYRIDGGAFQEYTAPFTVTDDGGHVVEYRARDNAGNTAAPKSVAVKIDRAVPATTARLAPAHPNASGWYDDAVTLTLRGSDGLAGSGIQTTQYRIGSGPWQTYTGPVLLDDVGTYSISYRSTDVAGNAETAGAPTVVKLDNRAPATRAQLASAGGGDGGVFRGPVRVTLTPADGAGSGVALTEYRVDGGAFQRYTGPFTVSAVGGHLVEYRSVDRAGNRENTQDAAFVIARPQGGGGAADPFVALSNLPDRLSLGSLVRRGVRVRATCVSVGRGTLRLTVSRKVARRLGLKNTSLASRRVTCGDDLKLTVTLKPRGKAARALKRARGSFTASVRLRMSGADGGAGDSARIDLRGRKRGG